MQIELKLFYQQKKCRELGKVGKDQVDTGKKEDSNCGAVEESESQDAAQRSSTLPQTTPTVEWDARTPQAVGTGPDFTLPQGPIFPSQPPFSHLLSSPGPATPCLVPSSPRPVRARSRPGHLKDFVATFHV
ncbi:hypothetical protein G5714_022118 [Onychostoma macrolepis]|uniref:Uncharacterized protein n=1 Tax=Onychostoma macrolepis TaxID=369639 RepID=A0A7J6BSY2_9TELE|nr:hypothetical protein G5714_022118 [Onychostoma macrolepis]